VTFCERNKSSAARAHRIVAAIEDVARDDVRHLVDEQRRDRDAAAVGEQLDIAALDRAGGDQPVAKRGPETVVVAAVRIRERGDPVGADGEPGIVDQSLVQCDLGGAGFLDGLHLGPPQIGAQERVGDGELARIVAREQPVAGGAPEIALSHPRHPRRSTKRAVGSDPRTADAPP
jgi:hypothetical protein